jgi:membrane-associated protease RseP (regulator of RpoE activity)
MFDISSEREEKAREILAGIMEISEIGSEQFRITVVGDFVLPRKDAISRVKERSASYGFLPLFRQRGTKVLIQFVPKPEKPKRINYTLNIVLFLLTIITTMFAGALQVGVNPITKIYVGIPFSFTIILILGAHELGHYFASKRLGIDATPPYFIPFPHLIGTFGAVIKVREPISDKRALLEIGIAGPFVGLFFAIPAVVIGLKLSHIIPAEQGGILLGNSLLFGIISKALIGPVPEGMDVLLHPVAFAGWIGFFVTAINLIPIGQLDGGHIMYGMVGRYQKWIAWIVFCVLVVLGFFWQGWFLWTVLIVVVIKLQHPPPVDDISPVPLAHKIAGFVSMMILVITFVPDPFTMTSSP